MSKLILIRGLPGSGKSTLAKQLTGFTHIEADMFFYHNGVYCFDQTKLGAAHEWCQQSCYEELVAGRSAVISNTFVRRWELQPTMAAALQLPSPQIILCQGRFTSIHNVPQAAINRMKATFEYEL